MKLTRLHVLFLLMCLIWGMTWIAVKAGIAVVPPSLFAGSRFFVAGGVLLIALRLRGDTMRIVRSDLLRLTVVTVLMIVVTYSLLFWGARFVSSGLAAILDFAFMPMALLGIGALLGEDRFTRVRACGMAVGVCGIVILFGPKALHGSTASTSSEFLGGAAIVLSALIYSLGAVLARTLLRTYSPLLLSGITLFVGGIILSIGAIAFEPGARQALSGHWGTPAWAGWVFGVLFGSLAANTMFFQLVREWGASRAGAYAFVSPAIAVALGVWVYGEAFNAGDAAGMTTMILGAWLTLRPASPALRNRKAETVAMT